MLLEECRNEERDRRLHPHYFFILFFILLTHVAMGCCLPNDITIPVLASSVMTSGILLPNDLSDSRNEFQVGPDFFHVISLKAQKKKKKKKNLSRENNSI
jgi:hypothetical protein